MSETVGTIIKLLAALTSPKACVKYITVAIALYLAWIFLDQPLTSIQVSSEQKSIILLLAGVGIGSLVGHAISHVLGILWHLYLTKKDKKKRIENEEREQKQALVEKRKKEKLLVEKFKSSFSHLTLDQRELLRFLTKENKRVDTRKPDNSALIKNGYIEPLLNVTDKDYLVQINPLIKDLVAVDWSEELDYRIKELTEDPSGTGRKLLEIMKNSDENAPVDRDLLSGLSKWTGVIRGDLDKDAKGYWLWFDDHILDKIYEKSDEEYLDELFISESRIQQA